MSQREILLHALASVALRQKLTYEVVGETPFLTIDVAPAKYRSAVYVVGGHLVFQTYIGVECKQENFSEVNALVNFANVRYPFGNFQISGLQVTHRSHLMIPEDRLQSFDDLLNEVVNWIGLSIKLYRPPIEALANGYTSLATAIEKLSSTSES